MSENIYYLGKRTDGIGYIAAQKSAAPAFIIPKGHVTNFGTRSNPLKVIDLRGDGLNVRDTPSWLISTINIDWTGETHIREAMRNPNLIRAWQILLANSDAHDDETYLDWARSEEGQNAAYLARAWNTLPLITSAPGKPLDRTGAPPTWSVRNDKVMCRTHEDRDRAFSGCHGNWADNTPAGKAFLKALPTGQTVTPARNVMLDTFQHSNCITTTLEINEPLLAPLGHVISETSPSYASPYLIKDRNVAVARLIVFSPYGHANHNNPRPFAVLIDPDIPIPCNTTYDLKLLTGAQTSVTKPITFNQHMRTILGHGSFGIDPKRLAPEENVLLDVPEVNLLD